MLPPPTPAQSRLIWLAITSLAAAALLGLIAALVWGLGLFLDLLSPVLWPLAVAAVLSYLLDPVVDFLERHRVPRTRAILLVFASALLLLLGLFASFAPQLFREAQQFAQRVPLYTQKIHQRVDTWATNPPVVVRKFLELRAELADRNDAATNAAPALHEAGQAGQPAQRIPLDPATLKSATSWLANALPDAGSWLGGQATRVTGWFGMLAGLFLVPVYAFYFLTEKDGIESQWTDYLPVRNSVLKDEAVFVIRAINDYMIVYFRSQVLVAICDGALYTAGFLVIGLPYAFLIGLVGTVLTMIPFIGAIATCAAAVVIGFASSGSWELPLCVGVVFAVVQAAEGLYIAPKILGDRVGLHPLTIIIAVMVGTALLGGILGGILAIPLTAALRVIMFRYVWVRRPAATAEADPPKAAG